MKTLDYQQFKHWGIVSDLPPEEVPTDKWTGGRNVQFRDKASERVGGEQSFIDTPGKVPLFAINSLVAGNAIWVFCTGNEVWVTDGTTLTDATPVGGLTSCNAGDWTGTILNGVVVLNNQHNRPMYWPMQVGLRCLYLPGWPSAARCRSMRAFKYHLFALHVTDVTDNPDLLWWSAGAAPGAIPQEWAPTPTNDAGDMSLADTPGGIIDGMGLRDNLIVYKAFSTYAISYVAGQYVFTQRKLFLTTGIQSRNCVTEINGEHWVFTGTDMIRHDGQNFRSVIDNKIKREIVDSVNPARIELPCMTSRHRDNQIWLSIPTGSNVWLNQAYIVNTLTEDVGKRDLPGASFVARGIIAEGGIGAWNLDPDPWDSDPTFWDQATYSPTEDSVLICSPINFSLIGADTTDTSLSGGAVTCFMERLSLPTNDNILRAIVLRVVPRVTGEQDELLGIRVGGQAYFQDPIQWSPVQPFVIGKDVAVNCQVEGRLISVRFEGTTLRKWRVHSYRLGVVDQGLY